MIELGKSYRDDATGYEGVATARTEYLGGNVNVRLERLKKDGVPEEAWWPEPRLVAIGQAGAAGFGATR
jgi:hypothetical protein